MRSAVDGSRERPTRSRTLLREPEPSAARGGGRSFVRVAADGQTSGEAMITTTPQGPTTAAMAPDALVDLLECVAAFGRSLGDGFAPAGFLAELSGRAQRLVPHDFIVITRRDDDGQRFSVFAEYAVRGTLLCDARHYTTAFARGDRLPADSFALAPVFEGDAQLVADMATDAPRGPDGAVLARMIEVGLRARLAVPVYAGRHVAGALVVMSATPGLYTEAHVSACRRIADLIGPFVETVVMLHRERRRRERLNAATALPAILGASLTVREVLGRLADAVRPLIDFDGMGLRLLADGGRGFERVGVIADAAAPVHPVTVTIEDYSVAERISRGDVVLIRDAERELDPQRPGDRLMIQSGERSILCVPLLFGERVGGGLLFASGSVNWYDESDVEVGRGIAAALVLTIQHQRLAEQQQRLGAVEARAQKLERRVASLRSALDGRFGFDAIVGEAPTFIAAVEDARKVAATGTTVLLTGESGTGKEVLARAIHRASARADGPFVAVNCAALPETLVESELFGHERGAFTGADRLKRGRFEQAAGGTLFLDEMGELAPAAQAKLLRVLQERKYERVGGTTTLEADVRLIAATNRDPERAVTEGRLREDLYYRLAVFRVHLPALRERGEDVLLLAEYFLRTLGGRMGKLAATLSAEARDLLLAHSWPGNIRELQNAVERALIVAKGELISAEHLGIPRPRTAPSAAAPAPETEDGARLHTLAEQEKHMIAEALRRAKGNKSRAAAELGLSRTQLLRRVRRLGFTR